MDWQAIQSSSLSATKLALQQSDFDVLWEHSWEAGYLPANSFVRISVVSNEVIGRPHIRFEESGSGLNCVLLEKEWQDRQLVLQFNVSTLNQTLSASANAVADDIVGRFNHSQIQSIYSQAGMSPVFYGPIIDNSEVGDRHRTTSNATFEVTFNVTSFKTINEWNVGPITAVEISGVLSGGMSPYNIDMYITSAYASSSFPQISGLMDDDLVPFHWESSKTVNFNFEFPKDPQSVVLYVADDVDNTGGVFIQGTTFNSGGFTVEVSAPFSGTIGYRAIYSPLSPNFPATVTSSLHPASGTLSASAGQVHTKYFSGNPATTWSLNYYALNQQPTDFYITHWSLGHDTGIPVITVDGFNSASASGSIDAPLVLDDNGSAGKLYNIAFVSGVI